MFHLDRGKLNNKTRQGAEAAQLIITTLSQCEEPLTSKELIKKTGLERRRLKSRILQLLAEGKIKNLCMGKEHRYFLGLILSLLIGLQPSINVSTPG